MFEGFELTTVEVQETSLRLRRGGSGPPVLLLHGHPQTHAMWHRVAPMLADSFSVVAADLPGYGDSSSPPPAQGHSAHSKRTMGRILVALMRELGHERFAVVGHDRGGRVAYRMALDHPDLIERLAVLDIVPTADMWRFAERAGKEFGLVDYHWYFLAQPYDFPERLIAAAPEAYYFRGDTTRFHPDALADYRRCVADPQTIHAMCEDYRAGATVDDELDEADRAAGRKIGCPVLALWAARDELPRWFDVVETWRAWADKVEGRGIDAGHFLAEESPAEVGETLLEFLRV